MKTFNGCSFKLNLHEVKPFLSIHSPCIVLHSYFVSKKQPICIWKLSNVANPSKSHALLSKQTTTTWTLSTSQRERRKRQKISKEREGLECTSECRTDACRIFEWYINNGPRKKGDELWDWKKATRNTTRHGGITSAYSEEGMWSSTLLWRAIVCPRGCLKLVQAARGGPRKYLYYLIWITGINRGRSISCMGSLCIVHFPNLDVVM